MIPNFRVVIEGRVYTSAQPYLPSHWDYLKSIGIKTILKLDYAAEGCDQGARDVGIDVIETPMPPSSLWGAIFGAPDEGQIAAALGDMCDESNWPLLWHCHYGNDRTGLLRAMFRVVKQGWSTEDARKEMLRDGFHVELIDLDRAWWQFCENQK